MAILRPYPNPDSKLLAGPRIIFGKERIVYVRGQIDQMTMEVGPEGPLIASDDICDDLLLLDREGSDPIKMVIHSPGGHVLEGFNILDTMNGLRSPVWTLVRSSGSFGSLLAISGAKGHRYMLPTAVLHLHGQSIVIGGKQADVEQTFKHTERMKNYMLDLLIERTDLVKKEKYIRARIGVSLGDSNGETNDAAKEKGRSKARGPAVSPQREAEREALMDWLSTDRFLDVDEAIALGLVDKVFTPEIQREFYNVPRNP